MLKIEPKVRVDEIASVLEGIVDAVVARVVEGNAERLLHLRQVEVIRVVRGRRRVIVRVYITVSQSFCGSSSRSLTANIIDATAAVVVVRRFDVVTAHVSGLIADLHNARGKLGIGDGRVRVVVASVASSCGTANLDLVEAAIIHVICELGVVVDGVVVGFDAVGAEQVSQNT